MDQLSLFDVMDDKQKAAITPEVWECVHSCANFTNIYENGAHDYFPGPGQVPRCTACWKGGKNGSPNWESKIVDNVWHTICRNYKPKGGTT